MKKKKKKGNDHEPEDDDSEDDEPEDDDSEDDDSEEGEPEEGGPEEDDPTNPNINTKDGKNKNKKKKKKKNIYKTIVVFPFGEVNEYFDFRSIEPELEGSISKGAPGFLYFKDICKRFAGKSEISSEDIEPLLLVYKYWKVAGYTLHLSSRISTSAASIPISKYYYEDAEKKSGITVLGPREFRVPEIADHRKQLIKAFTNYKSYLTKKAEFPGLAIQKPTANEINDILAEYVDAYLNALKDDPENSEFPLISPSELGDGDSNGPESYFKALPKFLYLLYNDESLAENPDNLIKEYKKLLPERTTEIKKLIQEILDKEKGDDKHKDFVRAILQLFKIHDFLETDFKGIQAGGGLEKKYPPRNLEFFLKEQEVWEQLAKVHKGQAFLPPLPPPPIVTLLKPFKQYIQEHATSDIEEAREAVGLMDNSAVLKIMHYEHSPLLDRILPIYRKALPEVPEQWLPILIKCDIIKI